jgi:glycosyltransferase involved in cell wall biosynthesis
MKKSKIIFINRFFYPDHSATSQFLSDLAFGLHQHRGNVYVIAGRQRYDDPSEIWPECENVHGVNVYRVWASRFGRQHLVGRALDYLTFYASCAWRLWRLTSRYDIVIAKTDPPLISVVAAGVGRLRKAILVNWIQDLFPEVASALGVPGMNGWAANMLRRLRNTSLRFARMNVVVGEGMAARLVGEGIPENSIRVIDNWADGRAIWPLGRSTNALRKKWGLGDKFVVGYSGNMGRVHEFSTILDAAELLRGEAHIVFLFIGDGAQRPYIETSVRKKGLQNFLFKPYQPREHLAQSLTVPDVHLISLQTGLEGLLVPSKFYGVAAAGRPILYIGNPDGDVARLVHETGSGAVISPGDATGLASQIRRLDEDGDLCGHMGQKARALFEQRFERRLALSAWKQLLAAI